MPLPKYKVGADPEFNVLLGGNRIPADKAWGNIFQNHKNFSGCTLETPGGELGCDGCQATAELRPKPDYDPRVVGENIATCFEEFKKTKSLLDLSTLSIWAPVGGHIHLELPDNKRENSKWIQEAHKKLVSFYLPVLLGEQRTNLRIRLKNYGEITDYREGGDTPTLELRSPSAEWLTSRKTAVSTLAYFSVLWHEINVNPKNLDKSILLKTKVQEEALQELAVADFTSLTDSLMKKIIKNVRTFELYGEYKKEIEFILNPEKVLAEKKKHNFLINSGWNLGTRKPKTRAKDFLKTKAKDLRRHLTGSELKLLGIALNEGDYGLEDVGELFEAVCLDGFRLKNRYYFYGLKQGVEGFLVTGCPKSTLGLTFFATPKIGSEEDSNRIYTVGDRMNGRANSAFYRSQNSNYTIDFAKNKVVQDIRPVFAIGIPYDLRKEEDFQSLLELVWNLENDQLKPVGLGVVAGKDPAPPLPNELTEPEPLTPDSGSTGFNMADSACRSIINEDSEPTEEADYEPYDDDDDDNESEYDKANSPNETPLCAE